MADLAAERRWMAERSAEAHARSRAELEARQRAEWEALEAYAATPCDKCGHRLGQHTMWGCQTAGCFCGHPPEGVVIA